MINALTDELIDDNFSTGTTLAIVLHECSIISVVKGMLSMIPDQRVAYVARTITDNIIIVKYRRYRI